MPSWDMSGSGNKELDHRNGRPDMIRLVPSCDGWTNRATPLIGSTVHIMPRARSRWPLAAMAPETYRRPPPRSGVYEFISGLSALRENDSTGEN